MLRSSCTGSVSANESDKRSWSLTVEGQRKTVPKCVCGTEMQLLVTDETDDEMGFWGYVD